MSLADNALLTAHRQSMVRRGFIRHGVVRDYATDTIREYGVKAGGPDAAARSLSGGNLQKYIVGREIRQRPRMMIAAQPTWGVDVGAAAQIRQALLDLRDGGVAVLVVSEELDELFEICDRLAVIAQGRLSDPKPVRETNAAEIGMLMSGSFIHAGAESATRSRPPGIGLYRPARHEDPPRSAPEPSRLAKWLSPVVATGAVIVIGLVLFGLMGKDPWVALYTFFIDPIDTLYDVGELCSRRAPSCFAQSASPSVIAPTSGTSARKASSSWARSAAAASPSPSRTPTRGSCCLPCSSQACSAAWRGPRFPRSCALASMPTRSWCR